MSGLQLNPVVKSRLHFWCDLLPLMDVNEWVSYECSDERTYTPVNCNNTGTLTADKHAHTSELHVFYLE
jgi:hypothetical protein